MMKRLLLSGINFYQREVSSRRRPICHYVPSCSEYARQAIEKYGAARGGWLAAKRVLRCHPFTRREPYDPVP